MVTQHFKRNLLLNYTEKEKISLVCFLLPLKRDKNVWHLQPISSIWRPLAFVPVTLSVCVVKAIFPVVTCGCESWTIKKAEHWRIDSFELWCWRRLLRVPWTGKRSNQSILKEINPEYQLEALLLKLELQIFGHLMWRADSLEKTLMLGKIESKRRGW